MTLAVLSQPPPTTSFFLSFHIDSRVSRTCVEINPKILLVKIQHYYKIIVNNLCSINARWTRVSIFLGEIGDYA